MTGPLCPISIYGSPVTLLKFHMAPRLILLMSSGSKKEKTHVWVKPKLHIHKECGPRFHPLLHTSYTMDCLTAPLDEEHFREERSPSPNGNQSYFLGCLAYSLVPIPCCLCNHAQKCVHECRMLFVQSWSSWWWAARLLETCRGLLLK